MTLTARHCLAFQIHAAQILGSTGPLFASDNSAGALRTRITYIPSIPAGSVLEGAIEIDPFDGTSIFTDTRWKNWGGAYNPLDMQIYNNAIWTLDPGVTLAFAPAAGVQMGAARLDAIGTAAAPIRFTSYGTPTPGAWDGILFLDASFNNSQLTNVVVEGASHAIETFKAAPVVSNALLSARTPASTCTADRWRRRCPGLRSATAPARTRTSSTRSRTTAVRIRRVCTEMHK